MRILLITGSFPPMKCGVGDYTASLAKALGKLHDAKVAVLTDARAASMEINPLFEMFPIVRSWKLSDLSPILKMIRDWKPDVVHIQYPTQGYGGRWFPYFLPILLRRRNLPAVQTWHEHLKILTLLPAAMAPGGLVAVRPRYNAVTNPWYRWLIWHKHFRYIPNASNIPRMTMNETERSKIRKRFTLSAKRLVVYFGFVYPNKCVELLFEIADPKRHHLVMIGNMNPGEPYHQKLLREHIQRDPWKGNVTTTGFLPENEVARILAAADAVVLPFRDGGGSWNTSLRGALIQGTFVITTSLDRQGYDPSENIYYAHPGDVQDMRKALDIYMGRRQDPSAASQYADWNSIADAHYNLYRSLLR